MLEGMEAISFGVRKRERLNNQWFRWKYREEIEVSIDNLRSKVITDIIRYTELIKSYS